MYSHGDFKESFYEHGCSIVNEKDILETAIRGNLVYLKRWWYNLFMLCYNDKRARVFYNSFHAMKVERARHFHRHRNCIHPLSKFRSFWDTFMLFVIIIYKILFHHNSSLISSNMTLPFFFMGVFLEFILFIDVYINTRCGYIDTATRKIVLDTLQSIRHYCSTKLFIHVASAMPLHSIMFLRHGMDIECAQCRFNLFHCTICLISAFGIPRLYEVTSCLKKEKDSFRVTCIFRFIRIAILGIMTILEFLTLWDTITLLTFLKRGNIEFTSYFGLVLFHKFQGYIPSNFSLFLYDSSRIFKSFLLYNFAFVTRTFYLDKICALVTFIIYNAFYMWGVIEAYSCVSRGKYPEDRIIENKGAAIRLAKCRHLPDTLCSKLQQYYDFNMTMQNIVEKQNGLYRSLPAVLKKEIILNCYSRMVMRIPYFSEWPIKIIESLIFLLQEETFLKHDLVAASGTQGDGLVIVDVGVMAVYSLDQREIGHLIDGDYFGELSLVTDKEIRTSYVVAVTGCKVLNLEKVVFRKFMRNYPDLFFEMKHKLREKYTRSSKVSTEIGS